MYWLYLWRSMERGWVALDELAALGRDPRGYTAACGDLGDALVCKVLRGAIDYACGVGARELVRRWVVARASVVERLLLATTVDFPPPGDVLPVWTSGLPLPGPAPSAAW